MAKRTLAAFPSEFFDCWRLAAAGKLRMTFPSRGKATRHKQEMNTYRRRLAEEAPEMAREFFDVDILVEGDDKQGIITGYIPEWKKQVREALVLNGFDLTEPAETMQEVGEQIEEKAKDSLSDTLASLGFTSSPKKENQ